MNRFSLSLAFTLAFVGHVLAAPEVSPAEAKLREGLRTTMLQLRAAQTEKAALQAAQAELEQKNQTLTEQLAAATQQLAADKETSDKRIAELTDRVVVRGNEAMALQQEVDKWKAAQKEAAALAAKKESDRAKVTSEKIVLERKVADQQAKNAAMYKIGSEVLSRYEKFGLGTAITAREPFIGVTRIKLQNLIQDLGDQLADQKIKP